MDLFLTKKNPEECNIKDEVFNNNNFYVKEEIFDNRIMKNAPDFMMDQDWSTNPDNFLDSIFSMNSDLLGDFDETKGFESIGDISEHIKKEAEGYEMANKLNSDFNIFTDNNIISNNQSFVSSNSSDSGLSSDNVDIELSPEYEPLSPAMSSPGPSVSERGERNSPSRYDSQKNILDIKKNPTIIETKPKVIVQKLPQILNFPQNQNNTKIVKSRTLNLSKGKEVKIVKLSPQLFTSAGNHKKLTFHLKNSQTGAKIQADPGTLFIKNANITEVKKLIRVQNASNPRSILLPVSIQDVKDLKTIKIVNTLKNKQYQQQLQNFNNNNNTKNDSMSDHTSDGDSFGFEETIIDEDDDDMVDDDDVSIAYKSDGNISRPNEDISYPKLILTGEEKRLLSKEGISLPTHYPLTKHEERELKRIRRKIRNKISAQDSRKRKKEYVDGLEERVKQCTEENQTLLKRIKLLQNQNQNLMSQMKKLQSLLSKGTNKTAQPTTCLMVLLLSLALVAAPNLKLGQNAKETELEEIVQETILQNRRNLLYDTKDQHFGDILDEEINMNDILAMNEILGECDSTQQLDGCKNNESKNGHSPCKKSKFLIDFDIDDQNWYQTSKVTDEIQTKKFNQIAEVFQKSMKSAQTSGFNIKDDQSIENFLDKDVLEMLSPKGNGLYELNLEKIDGISNSNTVLDIGTTKGIYNDDKLNKKINISELRNVKKY